MSVGILEQHWGFHFVLGGILRWDYKSPVLVTHMTKFYMLALNIFRNGFGGVAVACWPLVPKFAGSNPAEAVGFFRVKKTSARLPLEGK